jgi:hypothetical protein
MAAMLAKMSKLDDLKSYFIGFIIIFDTFVHNTTETTANNIFQVI